MANFFSIQRRLDMLQAQYIIPSFLASKVTLWEVKLQWYEEETKILHVFNGFARHCDKMDCDLTAIAEIRCSNDSAFLIEVSDHLW